MKWNKSMHLRGSHDVSPTGVKAKCSQPSEALGESQHEAPIRMDAHPYSTMTVYKIVPWETTGHDVPRNKNVQILVLDRCFDT